MLALFDQAFFVAAVVASVKPVKLTEKHCAEADQKNPSAQPPERRLVM